MKKVVLVLVIFLCLLAACGGDETTNPAQPTAAATAIEEEMTEPTATAVPEPTTPPMITTTEEMAGIWEGSVAGEKGYLMYTEDGRYFLSLSQEGLTTSPRITGDYWFENNQLHIRDLENTGHWVECPAETVGVYDVLLLDDGRATFQTVEDGCNEGGFTRNYIFANMTQKWLAEPADIAAPESMSDDETMPELAAALQAIADTWVNHNGAPGFILMVDAPDHHFTWKGAAGMADAGAGIEMVADDQYILSSITKMYTAVTIMKLVEQGQLSLDDPISLYLPEDIVSRLLVLDGESYGQAITVRHLLNHTSGLGDFSNGEDKDGNGLPDFKDLVLAEPDTRWDEMMVLAWAIANAPPLAQPGETFHYSDTNFQLLGLVVEAASGLKLHEAYRQLIFEPLGMEHTYFEFREEVVPGVDGRSLSHAYYNDTLWNDLESHSYEWGSGGLVSTVEDQNRFLWAWVKGDLFDDPASQEAMMDWIETTDAGAYYGLGTYLFVLDEWDIPGLGTLQGHGGLFNSYAFYWPEQNITLIGTLDSNQPPLGFIGVMIEEMFAIQGAFGG
ncbi:MAG: beta-lactamase family protein [Ardenticatenaceae bacterium]|nr:beta-lactamase family protein [Ardenticatenaceae bacterium]